MKTTALLIKDHQQILRALWVLEQMSGIAQRGEEVNRRDLAGILMFLQGFADRHHQGMEESVFFPALLRDRDQKNYRELCSMVFEHNRERSLVEGLEESIKDNNIKDFIYYAGRLTKVLREHIGKEENVLFELAEGSLPPAEDERVALEMENHDRQWQEKTIPDLLQRLDEMEPRYKTGGLSRAGTAVGG